MNSQAHPHLVTSAPVLAPMSLPIQMRLKVPVHPSPPTPFQSLPPPLEMAFRL